MKVFVFSAHPYEIPFLEKVAGEHQLTFSAQKLTHETACLATGCEAIAIFTADDASSVVLEKLSEVGVLYIALRSVGYDHVDLKKAESLGMQVANVPEYSPFSIAEHAVAMLMAVNRNIIKGQVLMNLQDFRLDTLVGFDVHGKTVGIIGTGKTGIAFARIMNGFGAKLLASDPVKNAEVIALGVRYVSLEEILKQSDIVSLHCPLNESTRYLLSQKQFAMMKKGCILINTARGGIINTADLIAALHNGTIGAACLDVYEKEKDLFFNDHRDDVLQDPLFSQLRGFKNVLITGHQAFLTAEALTGIATTTMHNINVWDQGRSSANELSSAPQKSERTIAL